MEDKRLDFSAPFLSVRRMSAEGKNIKKNEDSIGSKTYVPPFYKSELQSGPMRNAGAVPFVWEQIPGKRKDGEGFQDRTVHRAPVTPRLPPGRKLEVNKRSSDKGFEEKTVNKTRTGIGQTKGQKALPTVGNVSKVSTISKPENPKEREQVETDSDSVDGDEVYADALETLSRTESFFYNCSVSGISGLDETNLNRSRISATDTQTREFMMDRFLPAAKAMVAEAPQHTSRRQPVTRERSIIMKKTVEGDRQSPVYQYKPYIVPQYVQETVEEESEDEDYDFGDTETPLGKGCGWIPKFCSKSSFCLLNPVPGMKVRSQAPLAPGRKFSPNVRTTQPASYAETDDVNNWEAVYKHKLLNGLHPLDDESKLTSESNQLTYWSDSQTPDGSSPHTHSPGGVISPLRSEAIQSPFSEGVGFLGIPKQVKSSKVIHSISYKDSKWGSGSVSPMVEKTLYVDSEHLPTSASNMKFSDSRGMIDCREESSDVTECRALDMPISVSASEEIKDLTISQEKGILKHEMSLVVSTLKSSSDRSNPGTLTDRESRSLMHSEAGSSGNFMFDVTECLKEEDGENFNGYALQLPLAPPLPKSPSESWLWRTLPSISSKNGTSLYPRKHSAKAPSVDPKWETIVKTSNIHHGHLRFSEELKTPLPQLSET